MKTMLKAAAFAAAMLAGSAASAAIVIWNPSSPSGTPQPPVFSNIAPGDSVSIFQSLVPGDSTSYVFTAATKAVKISTIAFAATGTPADIANVEFGMTPATTAFFTTIMPVGGGQAFGGASLAGGILGKGLSFALYYEDGISAPVGVTTSFSVSAIPVPAALPLLAAGLGALGIARRRKAATAA